MLTDDFPPPHPMHTLIDQALNPDKSTARLATGVYLRPGFGGSNYVPGWEEWPNVGPPYGVCDCYQQVLEQYPQLQDPDRTFVLFLTEVCRDEQPKEGGWRWHKWGPYIGIHEPQHEYLHDEEKIDKVFCYHIYEKPALADVDMAEAEKRVTAARSVEAEALARLQPPEFTAAELRTVERYLQMRLDQTDTAQGAAHGNALWVELNLLVDQLKQVQASERAYKSARP